jgi:hypothetical protein
MNTKDNNTNPDTLPPKLRALYEAARKLARIRARMVLWQNTAKALEKRKK